MRVYMLICLLPLTLHNKQRAYYYVHTTNFLLKRSLKRENKKKKKKKNGLAAHTQPTGRLTNQWHNNSAQCGAHDP